MNVVRVLLATALLLPVVLGQASTVFAAEKAPIVLLVQGDEPDRVRDAVRARLGEAVVNGGEVPPNARRLVVHVNDTVVTVTYRDEKGRETTRLVQAASKASVIDAASILSENLVTDQTAMLLAQEEAAGAAEKKPPAATAPAEKRPWHPTVVSLVYPVATNMGKPNVLTHFALDALYGHIGELDGLQVSGLAGMVEGPVRGLQIGGLGTLAGGDIAGLQIAGLGAMSKGAMYGIQIGGLAAHTKEGVDGLQLAGIAAVSSGRVNGMQVAPVNVAGDMVGMQVGVVNVGQKVKGLQFGVVNIADDVDGVQFGAFNYSRTGRFGAVAWTSNHGLGNVGIKYMTKYAYTVVRGTYSHERGTDYMGPGFNVGLHVPVFNPLYVDLDVGTSYLFKMQASKSNGFDDHQARLLVGVELGRHVSLFGGGGISVQVERNYSDKTEAIKKELDEVHISPVFSGGLQVAY